MQLGAAAQVKSETIEDVVLRHSKRGMTVLRSYMSRDYCRQAARRILELEKGTILLTTGFYVAGHAETDGPLGTVVLAKALEKQGFYPVIITDEFCRGFFEAADLEVCYVDVEDGAEKYEALLEKFAPAALISCPAETISIKSS